MGRVFIGVFFLAGLVGSGEPSGPAIMIPDAQTASGPVAEGPTSALATIPEPAQTVDSGGDPTSESAASSDAVNESLVGLDDFDVAGEEIVILDEFLIDTDSIKPPAIQAEDRSFETMRDLSLQAVLPVVYADSATFEQQDTYSIAADLVEAPSHGELVFKNDRSLEFFYMPDEGYIGPDQFSFIPYTYHRPEYESTGKLKKVRTDREQTINISVSQLPRAIQNRTLRFDLSLERKVNILFVIDNSRSMAGEQRILASSFDRFIDGFLDQRLDFRIGVLTTDAVNDFQPAKRKHTAVFGTGYLQLTGEALARKEALDAARSSGASTEGVFYQPFLDNNTPDLTARFAELVQVGTRGYAHETAILPVMMSYVPQFSPGAIEHNTASFGDEAFFYQPDAFLSIVVVSDEDEAASQITRKTAADGTVTGYQVLVGERYLIQTRKGDEAADRLIASFLKSLRSLKREAGFRIDAVIKPRKRSVFKSLAEAGGGQVANIARDFSEPLITIGKEIARQASRTFSFPVFKVDEVFFPESIRVQVNGEEIPEDADNGWFFDPSQQTIELRGGAGEASFGGLIRVDYEVEYQP